MTVRAGRVSVCPESAGCDHELGCGGMDSGTERLSHCADLHEAEDSGTEHLPLNLELILYEAVTTDVVPISKQKYTECQARLKSACTPSLCSLLWL